MGYTGFSQITQTIRGSIVESVTQKPLPGATIVILGSDPLIGTTTNEKGVYRLDKLPLGRYKLQISFVGYKTIILANIELSSVKETVLFIEMEEEMIQHKAVTISSGRGKDKPQNEMAYVSARTFSIEETEKYPGSLGDPSRMAQSYAGIISGGDQVNDIIIRGNSPSGLLWNLEGINIPNPNHFGKLGSSGGPVSMLNNNVLRNSDLYTGAFPAEFGNATSGVFDLKMRPGNNEQHEYLAQVGANGFEFGMEGPFTKKHASSYLINYRYSTFKVFDALGLDLGAGALPFYQDLNFKLNFPLKKNKGISVFGIGGQNNINYYDTSRITKNYTSITGWMGVIGISYHANLFKNSYFSTSLAYSYGRNTVTDSSLKNYVLTDHYVSIEREQKISSHTVFKNRINARNNLNSGITIDYFFMFNADSFYLPNTQQFIRETSSSGDFALVQGFAEWKHKFTGTLSTNLGLHYNYLSFNNRSILEPRFGVVWEFTPTQSLSFGYGLHSQMQAFSIYYFQTLVDTTQKKYVRTNYDLDFSKSNHFILGYNYLIFKNLRLKTEIYYQYLFDIPVNRDSSYISMINYGASYNGDRTDSLVNNGSGYNYGLEITLEKFLSKNYYFLATASLFDSKYTGSDGVLRNTMFNNNYVFNLVGGYELRIKKNMSLALDLKLVWAGGMRKIPIDMSASAIEGRAVYDYGSAFDKRYSDYFRMDAKLSFKLNRKKTAYQIAIDLMNVTNRQNHFKEMYDPDSKKIYEGYSVGLIPVIFCRVNF
jgi:hypothetical protein